MEAAEWGRRKHLLGISSNVTGANSRLGGAESGGGEMEGAESGADGKKDVGESSSQALHFKHSRH
jgi:hypothetical protein